MVYAPQRRHAVHSISATSQAMAVVQHFYHPNILVLLARLIVQFQISGAPILHPERSLMSLFVVVSLMNATGVLLHCLDFAGGGTAGAGTGLVLDFVGQAVPASILRVVVLDIVLYALQVVSLVVTFLTGHAGKLEQSPYFPFDDLLLPTAPEPEWEPEQEETDPESGWRRKGRTAAGDDDDDDEIWLDDEQDELLPLRDGTSSRQRGSNGRRLREPPLIFSLSLAYILKLVFRLPSPPSAPRAFSGGTPIHQSPRVSPVELAPARTGPLFDSLDSRVGSISEATGTEDPSSRRSSTEHDSSDRVEQAHSSDREEGAARGGRAQGAAMPGGYWVSSGR